MKAFTHTLIISLLLANLVIAGTKLSAAQDTNSNNGDTYSLKSDATDESTRKNLPDLHGIDIPSPLKGVPEQILSRKGYVTSYNKDTKLPNWVAWRLTAAHISGEARRPGNAWHEDTDVPMPRATYSDYKGSGWSRGHMCPAGDNKWDSDAMYETFLYTNCCPQNANLNSGTWNQIEISCRRWAEKYGEVDIICGPIFFRQFQQTIGDNKVVVPNAFFKVIVCRSGDSPKGIGFICRNTDGNTKKDLYVNTIHEVERITGITFFPHLPKALEDSVKNKADLSDW